MTRKYKVLIYILVLAGVFAIFFVYHYSKHFVDDDELWSEEVTVSKEGIIEIFHSNKCMRSKPFFLEKIDKIDFQKTKFTVFDICIYQDEAAMLNSISKYNIKRILDRGWTYSDEIESFINYEENICDTTDRDDYEVKYCLRNGKSEKMKKSVFGFILLENMGRDVEW